MDSSASGRRSGGASTAAALVPSVLPSVRPTGWLRFPGPAFGLHRMLPSGVTTHKASGIASTSVFTCDTRSASACAAAAFRKMYSIRRGRSAQLTGFEMKSVAPASKA